MSKAETAKRYALFILGLFFSGLGVAFTKHGGLGVSPISSVANVLAIRFTFLTMGNWLILWNLVLFLGQIVILRRKFQPVQFLQVPLSFVFGYFTDLGLFLVSFIPLSAYPVRLLMVALGTVILGFGIALTVVANVIFNCGEGFVKAISDTLHTNFGNTKIVFDVGCVTSALVMSLLFFGGAVVGMREGTVIAALCTGMVVKFFTPRLRLLEKYLH